MRINRLFNGCPASRSGRKTIKSLLRYTRIVFLLVAAAGPGCSRQPAYPSPSISGTNAVIEIAEIKQDVPKFYTYAFKGKNLSFFVFKSDRGIISFLDACASCYPHKKGYNYHEGAVECRFCNVKFSLYQLEKGLGGCYPIKLEGRVENGKYLIPLASLEAEAGRF